MHQSPFAQREQQLTDKNGRDSSLVPPPARPRLERQQHQGNRPPLAVQQLALTGVTVGFVAKPT